MIFIFLLAFMLQAQDNLITKKDLKGYPKADRFGNIESSFIKQGKGSLLDADKLDGLDSNQFLKLVPINYLLNGDLLRVSVTGNSQGFQILRGTTTNALLAGHNNGGFLELYNSIGTKKTQFSAQNDDVSWITSGNFGIGTTNPITHLHIGNATQDESVRLLSNNQARLELYDGDASSWTIGNRSTGDLYISSSIGGVTVNPVIIITRNGPALGKALCLNSSRVLSACTSLVGADGTCTCP